MLNNHLIYILSEQRKSMPHWISGLLENLGAQVYKLTNNEELIEKCSIKCPEIVFVFNSYLYLHEEKIEEVIRTLKVLGTRIVRVIDTRENVLIINEDFDLRAPVSYQDLLKIIKRCTGINHHGNCYIKMGELYPQGLYTNIKVNVELTKINEFQLQISGPILFKNDISVKLNSKLKDEFNISFSHLEPNLNDLSLIAKNYYRNSLFIKGMSDSSATTIRKKQVNWS